jgi:hypothetical protein
MRTSKPRTKPTRVAPASSRPFGDGIDRLDKQPSEAMNPAPIFDNDCKPSAEPFTSTPEDREWAENALRGVFDGPSFWDQLSAIARESWSSDEEVANTSVRSLT